MREYAPHFYALAGPLGCGKGTDIGRALCGAIFIEAGAKGQLGATSLPVWQNSHLRLKTVHGISDDLERMVAWCESEDGSSLIRSAGALVIEDTTLAIEDSLTDWRRSEYQSKNKFWAANQRDLLVKALRAIGRHLGVLVVCVFHTRLPKVENGIVVEEGRLSVGSNKSEASNDISASADCVWTYEDWPEGPDPWWSKRYYCNPSDPVFRGKDRNDVLGTLNHRAPANFREYLRHASGTNLPRPEGLEWQDDIAERVAAAMADPNLKPVQIAKLARSFAEDKDPLHVRWAVQDGFARFGYRQLRGVFDLDDLPVRGAAGTAPPPPAAGGAPPPGNAPSSPSPSAAAPPQSKP